MNYKRTIDLLKEATLSSVEDKVVQKRIVEVIEFISLRMKERRPVPSEPTSVILTYTKNHFAPYTIVLFFKGEEYTEMEKKHFKYLAESVEEFENYPDNIRWIDKDTFIALDLRRDLRWIRKREETMFKEWMELRKKQ